MAESVLRRTVQSNAGLCIGHCRCVSMHACMRQVHVVFVKIPSNFGKSALAAEPVVDDNKDGTYTVRFTARELPCHAMPCHSIQSTHEYNAHRALLATLHVGRTTYMCHAVRPPPVTTTHCLPGRNEPHAMQVTGIYELDVYVEGKKISPLPFAISVEPGKTVPMQSLLRCGKLSVRARTAPHCSVHRGVCHSTPLR